MPKSDKQSDVNIMSVSGVRVAGLGQITDYLFIASRKTAEDSSVLIRFKMTCIINATQEFSTTRISSAEYMQLIIACFVRN
ncbi:uncharacterized protein zgc:153044 isoform X4 [Trichomycterus rosablanca]|uniref:uncharacterized protein zgc:153044 isoform X4 n=1 Tax=Trichomycterus rosablanca TaxID=2290929 RepID=UPI002F3500C8